MPPQSCCDRSRPNSWLAETAQALFRHKFRQTPFWPTLSLSEFRQILRFRELGLNHPNLSGRSYRVLEGGQAENMSEFRQNFVFDLKRPTGHCTEHPLGRPAGGVPNPNQARSCLTRGARKIRNRSPSPPAFQSTRMMGGWGVAEWSGPKVTFPCCERCLTSDALRLGIPGVPLAFAAYP